MVTGTVTEKARSERAEMAHACVEIRRNLVALEKCLSASSVSSAPKLAQQASRLVSLFVQIERDARSERVIRPECLRTVERVFYDFTSALGDAMDLVELFESVETAREHMASKFGRLGELVGQCFLLLDLPMGGT